MLLCIINMSRNGGEWMLCEPQQDTTSALAFKTIPQLSLVLD